MGVIMQLGYAVDVQKMAGSALRASWEIFSCECTQGQLDWENRPLSEIQHGGKQFGGFSALISTERSFLWKAWFTIIYYLSSSQDGWLWRRCWMGWSRRELIFCNMFPLLLPVVLHQKAKPQNTRHWNIPQQLLLPRSAVRSAVKRNKHTIHVIYLISNSKWTDCKL